tara:strand:- start:1107 stop:1286 length:180 start_codon:yes stop_codon:yes gene_type:complete
LLVPKREFRVAVEDHFHSHAWSGTEVGGEGVPGFPIETFRIGMYGWAGGYGCIIVAAYV